MKKPSRLLTLTPFRAGCLLVLAACLLQFSFSAHKPDLFAVLDSRAMDGMFRLRGPQPTRGQVVIVDIDEKSLQALGQWPWPRDVVARLVDRMAEAGAKVVGFDVVFAEPDRTSPHLSLGYLRQRAPHLVSSQAQAAVEQDPTLNNDLILGRVVASLPSVLGYVFLTRNDGLKTPGEVPFPSLNLRTAPVSVAAGELPLPSAYRAVLNVPAVAQASSEGFFNFFPDAAGMVHKVPLFLRMDGLPYPSLALEMFRVAAGEPEAVVHVSELERGGRMGIDGISLGSRFIPTDLSGQMTVNYRGPVGTFPYVSAVDILNGLHLETLQDRYVLLGTTAAGLHDLRATPFSTIFPGVEIHATIIDNLLADDIMTHDLLAEQGLSFSLILFGGMLLSALLAFGSPLLGALGGLGLIISVLAVNYQFFFCDNQMVGMTYPLAVILTIFPLVSIVNYFHVGLEKRFIDTAFSRYISPQVAQQLKRDPSRLTLSGTEKELTVLFSDIRDFTGMSEQMTATQLGRFMNRYLTGMSREILRRQGTVDKFIGDAIMAIWNAPLDDAEHAQHAVQAALGMLTALQDLQDRWVQEGLPHIEIGVGINTGLVSVGNFGSEERFDYTVIGDNVNLASRLEGLTKLYGVPLIIAESTRQALGDAFYCRQLDRVRVAGKDRPVAIFQPLMAGLPSETLRRHVTAFETALGLYYDRQFATALEILEDLHNQDPCRLYLYFVDRVRRCLETPPGADWDGVTVHARK